MTTMMIALFPAGFGSPSWIDGRTTCSVGESSSKFVSMLAALERVLSAIGPQRAGGGGLNFIFCPDLIPHVT